MINLAVLQELKRLEFEQNKELECLKKRNDHLTWKLEKLVYVPKLHYV